MPPLLSRLRLSQRRWFTVLLLLLIPVTALGTALGITQIRGQASAARDAQLLLVEVQAQANAQNAAEWKAIAKKTFDVRTLGALDAGFKRMDADLARLALDPAEATDAGGIRTIVNVYAGAVRDELALLARGKDAAAERVDEERVDPAFALLSKRLERLDRRVAGRSHQAEAHAADATWAILSLAAVLMSGLLIFFYRSRRRELLAAARHRWLEREVDDREQEANTDALTGLANRRRLMTELRGQVDVARAQDCHTAVLLIDLDGFKEINDALGHGAGDTLLELIGPRVQPILRDHDLLARLGGDEFALLVPADRKLTTEAAASLAERVRAAIARPFSFEGLTLHVQASIGIAVFPAHGEDAEALLQHADVAMYVAKRARSGHVIYDPGADTNTRDRLALTGQLRNALDQEQLVVHYQPKADLRTGEVHSLEALVRWEHPERGLLPPAEFLPVAEQAGLMRELTLYVLDRSLAQCATWLGEGIDLSVAVNLSVANLVDDELPRDVSRLLAVHGVAPSHLQLEITENLIMADPARATEVITELAGLGVSMSLDDFGTGYSSLAYLKRLAVDEIKIDRSFVMGLTPDSEDAVIVRSTVELGRSLGLRVVAEGVETPSAWEQLEEYGCDQAQGYYLSRPMPAPEITAWLLDRANGAVPAQRSQATS
jgi:diguanylate cyclase (GGDEF)-like protein